MHLSEKGRTNVQPRLLLKLIAAVLLLRGAVLFIDYPTAPTLVRWQSPTQIGSEANTACPAAVPDRKPGTTGESSDKLLLYYFSAEGSEPCLHQKQSFGIPAIANLVNNRFVPIGLLHCSKLQHNSAELSLVRKFKIHSVPAIVVVSTNGKVIDRMVGAKEPGVVYEFLCDALRGRPAPMEED